MQYNTETGSAENHAMTAATTNTNCLNHLQVTGPFPLLYLFHLYIVCAEVDCAREISRQTLDGQWIEHLTASFLKSVCLASELNLHGGNAEPPQILSAAWLFCTNCTEPLKSYSNSAIQVSSCILHYLVCPVFCTSHSWFANLRLDGFLVPHDEEAAAQRWIHYLTIILHQCLLVHWNKMLHTGIVYLCILYHCNLALHTT